MRIEVLDAPPADLTAELLSLVSNICPFPGCAGLPSRIVEFRDGWRGRLAVESSLPLCASHAEQAGRGEIEPSLLRTIRQLLRPARGPRGVQGSRALTTREEYLCTIRDRVQRGTRSLRGVYVGPLPLHPDWYFNLRDGATGLPNMDRPISACLDDPDCETFLIFRNTARYTEKVRELLPADLIPALAAAIIDRIDAVYGQNSSNHMVCQDTGIFHIPVILDDAVITAFRPTPQTPVGGGFLVTDVDQVRWEREAFCSDVRLLLFFRSWRIPDRSREAVRADGADWGSIVAMTAPLVAFSRKLDAIDLTASLWLARSDEAMALPQRRILWIADPRGTYSEVQRGLESLADALRSAFSIEVISYSEAWRRSAYKTPAELFARLRMEIAASGVSFPCRVRIHHGSLDVEDGAGSILRAHCLEFRGRDEEKFGVSPSGRPGTWTSAVPPDITGISGSLHLYLAEALGEVVNLPWYALAPSLAPVAVRETISPVAFYSTDRYHAQETKLSPTGYSLIDYPLLSLSQVTGKITMPPEPQMRAYSPLLSDYPRTSARIGPRAPGSAELTCELYPRVRRQIMTGDITVRVSGGMLTSSIPAADIVGSMLVIAVVGRVLESIDRGHAANVPVALMTAVSASGILETSRAGQIGILLESHAVLAREIARYAAAMRGRWLADAVYARFGEIARLCVASAMACAEAVLLDLAVRLKASVPALARVLDGDGCARAYDSLAEARSGKSVIRAAGSVLSYVD